MQKYLFEMQDLNYRDFHSRLMPNIDKDRVIGVRTPMLRSFAKKIAGTSDALKFINTLPHYYYEENNLHSFLISQIKDFEICIYELERFLPYIDNWATCDMLRPKILSSNPQKLLERIEVWIKSEHEFTVRFAIEMLMLHFLDKEFKSAYLNTVAAVHSEKYYVNMMIAWYFAEALVKQYDFALPYIENAALSKWCHNKAIQKAIESYRISPEIKAYLKTLKLK